MDNIKIRRARIEDIKNIIPAHMGAWKYAYDGILDAEFLEKRTNPNNFAERIERWEKSFGDKYNEIVLVAEKDDEIIGFASGGTARRAPEADREIMAFYINPSYHNLGIGRRLFNAFADIVRAEGAKTIVIGCLSENKSIGFYKKMGGKILKEGLWEYEKGKAPETFFIFDIR